jgi:hypothetical protein
MVSEPLESQRSSMAYSSSTSSQNLNHSNSTSSENLNQPIEISPITSILLSVTQLPGLKLDDSNYIGWVAQFQPILHGHDLQGLIDGTDTCPPKLIPNSTGDAQVVNPAYVTWQRKDQHLLSLIIWSLSPPLVSPMYGLNTSRQAWTLLADRYAAQSRSNTSHLKRQLQSLQQGGKSCTEYLTVAKNWADQLAAVGKPVEDDDLISFIISGLNPMFNSFITAFSFAVRDHEMSFNDFRSELLSYEILLQNQQQQAITPEPGSFALHINQSHQPNFPHSTRRPRFPARYSPRQNTRGPPFSLRHNNTPKYNNQGHSGGPPLSPTTHSSS